MKAVGEVLGRDLSRAEQEKLRGTYEWGQLEDGTMPAEVAVADCAAEVRSWGLVDQADAGRESMPAGEAARMKAKALLCWTLANEDPEVDAWRTEHLGGELLRASPELDPLEALEELRRLTRDWVLGRAGDAGRVRGLAFPDGEVVGRVSTTRGTVLDDLRQLSERLAGEYAWTEDTATTFVLTDAVPMPKWVQVTDHYSGGRLSRRVVLDVDADTPAEVVAEAYNAHRLEKEREEAERRGENPPKRHRQRSKESLAVFADWLAHDRPPTNRLPLRRWDEEQDRHYTRDSALKVLQRCWEHFTDEPLSR